MYSTSRDLVQPKLCLFPVYLPHIEVTLKWRFVFFFLPVDCTSSWVAHIFIWKMFLFSAPKYLNALLLVWHSCWNGSVRWLNRTDSSRLTDLVWARTWRTYSNTWRVSAPPLSHPTITSARAQVWQAAVTLNWNDRTQPLPVGPQWGQMRP